VELLIVLEIVGILVAVAVPSYLGYRIRANRRASAADVRSAINDAELYWSDPSKGNLTYKNMSLAALKTIDPGVKLDAVVVSTDNSTYCLHMTVGGAKSLVIRGVRAQNGGLVQENVSGSCPAAGAL
jgi:Tfp pilus assembly protein PilE